MVLGDGKCNFNAQYMIEECGYEYGDCMECKVTDPSKLGNGICDWDAYYNTEECGFDNGDCVECNGSVDRTKEI